jgi:hypothetical protein
MEEALGMVDLGGAAVPCPLPGRARELCRVRAPLHPGLYCYMCHYDAVGERADGMRVAMESAGVEHDFLLTCSEVSRMYAVMAGEQNFPPEHAVWSPASVAEHARGLHGGAGREVRLLAENLDVLLDLRNGLVQSVWRRTAQGMSLGPDEKQAKLLLDTLKAMTDVGARLSRAVDDGRKRKRS